MSEQQPSDKPTGNDEREESAIIDGKASRTKKLSIGLGALGGLFGLPLLLAIFVSIADGVEFLLGAPAVIGPIMGILIRLFVGGLIGSLTYDIRKQRKEPEVLISAFFAGLIGTGIITFCIFGALVQ